MASPYDEDGFETRVNFAAKYISEGRRTTRHFDTCFESFDGDYVVEALMRRAVRNKRLRDNLFRYINEAGARRVHGQLQNIPRRKLAEHAKAERERRARKD